MPNDILDVVDKVACFFTFHDYKRLNDKVYTIDYNTYRPCKCAKCGKKTIIETNDFCESIIVNNKQEIWDDYYKKH